MMAVSMRAQAMACVAAFLFGVLCGVLWDVFRTIRVLWGLAPGGPIHARLSGFSLPGLAPDLFSRRPGRFLRRAGAAVTFCLDLVYMALCGAAFTVFLYWQSEGVFRAVFLLAALAGFAVYEMSVGRGVYALTGVLAFALHAALAYLFLLLRVPALWLGKGIARLFRGVSRAFCAAWRVLAGHMAERRVLSAASRAFIDERLFGP